MGREHVGEQFPVVEELILVVQDNVHLTRQFVVQLNINIADCENNKHLQLRFHNDASQAI